MEHSDFALLMLMYVSGGLLALLLWLLIMWAIIRGAVLSALRKNRVIGQNVWMES
ncbi:hypothetical protein ACSAGD_07100 [Paramicrobacterium sp. CJ85]|uniref:hypothetical protein n=1 Tax=Paramicrobacterium sp. CJ85 TaxID=3445355 RepID=UPI003F5ED0E6